MLSDNPEESGLRYENHDNDYTLCMTQLDVDDVDKDGNKDELLPIKIHIAKGDVCNNTESTQCPVKVNNAIAIIQNLGSEHYYTSDNQSQDPWLKERECLPTPSNIIRGSYEQGVSDNLVKKGKWAKILPKSYVDTTSTQININDNNIWQTSGNVVFNDNSVIIGNNSSATTTNILLISSNMADEKFTEFVVNIPEVSTGTIQIGLRDYYLQISRSPFGIGTEICRVNAYDVNFPTPWCGGVPRNYVGRHTFRIVDKNDIWNVERSLYIDGEYISNDYVEYTHLRDNPEYFYITNMNTNSQVILERLETGTNNYVFADSGTYTSTIFRISVPNATAKELRLYTEFINTHTYNNTEFSFRISLDNGSTWSEWSDTSLYPLNSHFTIVPALQSIHYPNAIPFLFPKQQSIPLDNVLIQFQATLKAYENNKWSSVARRMMLYIGY